LDIHGHSWPFFVIHGNSWSFVDMQWVFVDIRDIRGNTLSRIISNYLININMLKSSLQGLKPMNEAVIIQLTLYLHHRFPFSDNDFETKSPLT